MGEIIEPVDEPNPGPPDAGDRLGSAYQAVGQLLEVAGFWDADQGLALLDMLSDPSAPIPDKPWTFEADAAARAAPLTVAARDVLSERRRHVEVLGYTAEHDDAHTKGEIIDDNRWGAIERLSAYANDRHPDPRHCLVETAALIIAEIERLDRAFDRLDAEALP